MGLSSWSRSRGKTRVKPTIFVGQGSRLSRVAPRQSPHRRPAREGSRRLVRPGPTGSGVLRSPAPRRSRSRPAPRPVRPRDPQFQNGGQGRIVRRADQSPCLLARQSLHHGETSVFAWKPSLLGNRPPCGAFCRAVKTGDATRRTPRRPRRPPRSGRARHRPRRYSWIDVACAASGPREALRQDGEKRLRLQPLQLEHSEFAEGVPAAREGGGAHRAFIVGFRDELQRLTVLTVGPTTVKSRRLALPTLP